MLVLGCGLAAQAPAPGQHPIATGSPAAQRAFDRGLALVYGFNFKAAQAQFRRAASLDPSAPMPWWGLALALGPNLNAPWPSRASEIQASNDLSTARILASKLPDSPESRKEKAYVAALTLRLTCQPRPDYPKLAANYAAAMGKLAAAYPDDPDAATLYAAALMVERHNQRFGSLAPPIPKIAQILAVLQRVLRRWPSAIGANHFYIHASEGAGRPGQAFASARLLDQLHSHGFFGDGHLLHMPAHVYLRTGHYRAAERSTLAAAIADQDYLAANPTDTAYAAAYAQHNLAFLVVAASMDGDYRTACATAQQLSADARATAVQYPATAARELAPLRVAVRFGRWDDILNDPPAADASVSSKLFAAYARASALAGEGEPQRALQAMHSLRYQLRQVPRLRIGTPPLSRPTAANLLLSTLEARIAAAQGKFDFAAAQIRQAMAAQKSLGYREPPVWSPLGESLGSILLRGGHAAQAEAAFRACLQKWPDDPRAEFGLARALDREGKPASAAAAMRAFQAQWKGGPLRLADF